MRLTAQGVLRQLFVFSDTGGGGEQRIGRGVQRGFAGVLQDADDEAHGDHLHGDIVRDTRHITGQRDQQQRPAPATPEAPQAHSEATTLSSSAVGRSTGTFSVCTAARVRTVMVIAAPAMLMVAPSGIETE